MPGRQSIKILLLDLETRPIITYTWSLFSKFTPINHMIEPGSTICYTAKWLGEDEVLFDSVYKSSRRNMVKRVHKLLDKADSVIHYNGKRFDIPVLEAEFLQLGMAPPSPFQQIDLYNTVKRFSLPSRKLNYVCQALGIGKKVEHKGMELWKGCIARDPESWAIMEAYNRQDVVLLEELYDILRPWVKTHPNRSINADEESVLCPVCGSDDIRYRGYREANTRVYRRFQCNVCGTWGQHVHSEPNVAARSRIAR